MLIILFKCWQQQFLVLSLLVHTVTIAYDTTSTANRLPKILDLKVNLKVRHLLTNNTPVTTSCVYECRNANVTENMLELWTNMLLTLHCHASACDTWEVIPIIPLYCNKNVWHKNTNMSSNGYFCFTHIYTKFLAPNRFALN